jgi:hypothetical protein
MRDNRSITNAIGDVENTPLRVLLAILGHADSSAAARLPARRTWAEIGRR